MFIAFIQLGALAFVLWILPKNHHKWKGVYFFLFSISAQSSSETRLTLENKFSVSNTGGHVEVVF